MKVRFCVELFCGSARWSKAIGRRGYYCVAIDMRFGGEHDLTGRELQQRIHGWAQAAWVIAVLAGFPCTSFSRARNMPGGPPALRISDHFEGWPGLCQSD